jgi:acyl-CoA thioester hydrolase
VNLSEIEPILAKLPLVCARRVLYGEVDKMNFVYYGNYLAWFEHGRNEYLRLCGLPYTEVEDRGVILPVFESHVWYLEPVRYDDLVEIRCAVIECTKTSAVFLVALMVDGKRVAAGYTKHVCLGPERKPVRMAEWLREKVLERYDVGTELPRDG